MSNESRKLAALTHRIASEFGVRRCTHCNLDKSNQGGLQIPFSNGLRYRWICKECKERRAIGNKNRKKVDG